MRILVLEPFYGGSHKAFLDGWQGNSRHSWTVVSTPATKWKWRMRHTALTFAQEVTKRIEAGESWDLVLASDMLDLAAWRGLVHQDAAQLPTVLYMHENQFTYPNLHEEPRDQHFGYTNFTSMLAADAVWWNSAWHMEDCLREMEAVLRRMPDHHHADLVLKIRDKSQVQYPGIAAPAQHVSQEDGPLHILWAARWEHDKNPQLFFDALRILESEGGEYRLSVAGEHFAEIPAVFADAEKRYAEKIVHWGYFEDHDEYLALLQKADVFVSTADHEFFGIAVAEALAAGCHVLAPTGLAYPEVLQNHGDYLYDKSSASLARRLTLLAADPSLCNRASAKTVSASYLWTKRAVEMDDVLDQQLQNHASLPMA